MAGADQAACDVVVHEEANQVTVRLILCRGDYELYPYTAEDRAHIDLAEPLGARAVIDYETGEQMPFYVPTYFDNQRLTAPGFYTDPEQARAAREPLPPGAEPEGWAQTRWPVRTLGF